MNDPEFRNLLWVSVAILGILVTGIVVLAITGNEGGIAGACLVGAITALTAVIPSITYSRIRKDEKQGGGRYKGDSDPGAPPGQKKVS